jgi:small subunit ribosomal protein S15
LEKEKKTAIVGEYGAKEGDTGSTEVQVALLTERIAQLTTHMAANRKDFHTQRGLLKLVGQRRRLLAYLSREDVGRYNVLIKKLGLRK